MAAYQLGFIGTGNMGSALARAACKTISPARIALANRTPEKAAALAEELGCAAVDNKTAASSSEFLFLGVKPQMMAQMLEGIRPALDARHDRFVLVSMAAGLPIARIREMAGPYPVIRIMPNTPVSVGAGTTLYSCSDDVTMQERASFLSAMSAAGAFDELPEALIDAGSAISGCGPAYVCLFLEALADGGVACGLPRKKALAYATQTLRGTAELLLQSGEHPGVLKDAVCSPAGSTIAGVHALEAHAFRAAAAEAVEAAFLRTKELGK